jgi:D-arginine dehydrogenase
MTMFDTAIIGAGIAGASLAAEIIGKKSVLILEAESLPGYHATGRSAAFWSETYGGPAIQPLTSASGPFLTSPPPSFCDQSFLRTRGALHLGMAQDKPLADRMLADFASSGVTLNPLAPAAIATRIAGLKPGWTQALWEPDCRDIDSGRLHAAYLRHYKKRGGRLVCDARVKSARYQNGRWIIETGGATYSAKVLINAAGAWADQLAQCCGVRAIGIQPYRRTMIQLAVEPAAPANLPLVVGLDGSFYFKPEAGGKLWLSPHDETACPPCDVAPEEMDVATAIDQLHQVVDWKITRLDRKWAGLRSFAPDRLPVIGRDPMVPEFFWLAGQGGFGIQTSPAIAKLAAALLLDRPAPFSAIDAARYAPDRFS